MKNIKQYLYVVAFIVFTFSCKKEILVNDRYTTIPGGETIELMMQLPVEGKKYKWKPNIFAICSNVDSTVFSFNLGTYWNFDPVQPREHLKVINMPFIVGKYELKDIPFTFEEPYSYFLRQLDDGPIDGRYKIDSGEKSWIEIKSVDIKTRTITGNFDIHYIIDQQGFFETYPKKVHFYNAPFNIKVYKL